MSITQIVLIVAAFVIAILVYFLLRKSDIKVQQKKWIRILLYGCIVSYLAIDFYSKQKYGLLFVLGLGSVAFVYMILNSDKK